MKFPAKIRHLLRIALVLFALGAVAAIAGWIWAIAECCEGGANIGAGMVVLLGYALLGGGALWALFLVLVGIRSKR